MTGKKNHFRKFVHFLLGKWKERPKLYTITGILLFLFVLFGCTTLYYQSALKPADPSNHKMKRVEIPPGSNVMEIGSILKAKGIIKNAYVFSYYVKSSHKAGFQAGTYKMTPSMKMDEIINSLQKGGIAAIQFTIPEGSNLGQIAAIISRHSSYSSKQVLQRAGDRAFIEGLMKKYPRLLTKDVLNQNIMYPLEGYFYPATYSFYHKHVTLDEILDSMVAKTNAVFASYQEKRHAMQLSPHQLLTIASLIEEEATQKADRTKIASVFYNRLEKKMPLQTDPTIIYALHKHKEKVTYKDLRVNSPYNTYKHKGLPPGPIASPGEQSLQAALIPAKTNYLYFLADMKTGRVYFAKTLKEHNELKEKYIAKAKQ